MTEGRDPRFEALLDHLRRMRGVDLSGYKRSSLMRRLTKRLQMVGIGDYLDYVDYLEVHPEEFQLLFDTILINITSFFRDWPTWEFLQKEIIPRILEAKQPGEPVRVWSAGCASGEEAYSLAIMLAEAMGLEGFQKQVKIYASDMDEKALSEARAAGYGKADIEAVPEEWRRKYFVASNDRWVFRPDLRRAIIFGRHDLVQDAPISRLDLLSCRNTLMYLNAATQGSILARFHFALNDVGFLFLGKAEMLLTHTSLFTPMDLKHRVFCKASRADLRDRLFVMAQTGDAEAADHLGSHIRVRESAFDASPVAQLVVDPEGTVALANERLRAMFGLSARDIGKPLQDLEISYRPVDLRSLIEQAMAEKRSVRIENIERRVSTGGLQYLDVEAAPLQAGDDGPCGVNVSFQDVTRFQKLKADLQRYGQELETSNEELQSAQEELETTNEELQSTNEELETTNEELQSTNEELETMNEELQSTNEELETINKELQGRTVELDRSGNFLNSILASITSGVIVVDRDLRVLIWNHGAEDFWGMRADEVRGRSILSLGIGLPVDKMRRSIQETLKGQSISREAVLPARNRRGKDFECVVSCTPLAADSGGDSPGVVLMMRDGSHPAEGLTPGAGMTPAKPPRATPRKTSTPRRKRVTR